MPSRYRCQCLYQLDAPPKAALVRASALALLFGAILLSAVAPARAQSPLRDQTRREFGRFFEMRKKAVTAPAGAVGAMRAAAAEAVKAAPGKDAKRRRLLEYQERRAPQPDARAFVADNPILEEVSVGEDREFAQVIFWNEVAMRVTANDHTEPPTGSNLNTNPFEQVGPARTSRAMAIVHIAMFEAINAVHREYESYKGIQAKVFAETGHPSDIPPAQVSVRHAIAQAAYRTLVTLYPGKEEDLNITLSANLTAIQSPMNLATTGMEIGEAAAKAILKERELDGSELAEPPSAIYGSLLPVSDPLKWRQDPLNASPAVALGSNWRHVRPFVLEKSDQFRPAPPPAVGSPEYQAAFTEVLLKGGDPEAGVATPPGNADRRRTQTTRTDDETFIGKYWAYDGTALLCAPPRLYNMIATSLALKERRDTFASALELARFLALVNVAMADAGVAAWEAKYYYLYPRPVTLIRATTLDPLPAPLTVPMRFWTPLGAPVTNGKPGSVNFSPPFPAYPSGHATFGGGALPGIPAVLGWHARS